MSRESKATKEEIQRNRDEAYQNGWGDGYAEGFGKATEAADRIEALTEQLAAARQDAKEAEAYAGELEAKLAKAVDAINVATRHEPKGLYPDHVPNYWLLRATLAEIKGESHD